MDKTSITIDLPSRNQLGSVDFIKPPIKNNIRRNRARRIRSGSIGIFLYDLGYVNLEGSTYDIPWSDDTTVAISHSSGRATDLGNYNALNTFILSSTDPSEFSSTFNKIIPNQADIYDLRVSNGVAPELLNSGSDFWDTDKIALPESYIADGTIFDIICPSYYTTTIRLKGSSRNKITAENDYFSEDLTGVFAPTASMKIYMMPRIVWSVGSIKDASTTIKFRQNNFFTIWDRDTRFNESNPYHASNLAFNNPYHRVDLGISGGWPPGLIGSGFPHDEDYYQLWYYSVMNQQTKAGTRKFYTDSANPAAHIPTSDPFPGTLFTDPAIGYPTLSDFYNYEAYMIDDYNSTIPNEALVAIVEKDGTYYYVWNEKV